MDLSHLGVTWGQFSIGIILFIFYWYISHSVLHDWYFTTLNSGEVALIDFAILLLPLGWILFQSALHRLLVFQRQYYQREITITFAILCLAASGAIGFAYFFKWQAVALVSWDEDVERPALILLSIGLFLICMMFFVVLSMIVLRLLLFTMYSSKEEYSALGDDDDEAQTLLEMQDAPRDDEKSVERSASGSASSGSGGGTGTTQYGSGKGNNKLTQRLENEKVWAKYDSVIEYSFIIGYFIILVPGLLFLNGVMPGDWHYLFPVQIESYNIAESHAGWAFNVAYNFRGETYYMKIYGDLIVYFGFITIVGVISWLCMKSVGVRLALRRRILISPIDFSMSLGQIIFWLLWGALMFIEIYYWLGVHEYQSSNTKLKTEVWARFFGVLSIILLSFMFLTVTRIRLWNDCFGLSSDHLVLIHRIFAYCMLTAVYMHMLLWIIWFANSSEYPLSENFIFVASLPFTFSDDNFSIAISQVFAIFFIPVAYFICSSSYVRRKMFEVFYIVHLYSALVFIVVTLWHATQSWRYLFPCLVLYAIDRCLRFYNSTNFARIDNMEIIKMGSSTNLERVTKIGFRIAQFGTTMDGDTRAFFGNIRYKMGQFCFIHIPQISTLEWHPFTISSGPYDRQVTFHIKSMGEDQFSGKLAGLEESSVPDLKASSSANSSVQKTEKIRKHRFWKNLEIFIDGPYGIPFSYEGYDRVVLVAGGIGITPCHSIISGMLVQSMSSQGNFPAVDLVWMVRNPEMFDLFKETWNACKNNDKFSLHFYHTRASEQDISNQEIVRAGIRYQPNRPRMENALRFLSESDDKNQLVFCCGPTQLASDCEITATQYGAHFYAESFDFSKGDDIKVGSITVGVFGICLIILGAICQML